MAQNFDKGKDSSEIAELAALNEDITDDMIEQLSRQLEENYGVSIHDTSESDADDDTTLFEETQAQNTTDIPQGTIAETEKSALESAPAQKPEIDIPSVVDNTEETLSETKPATISFGEDSFMKKFKAKQLKKAGKENFDTNSAQQSTDDSSEQSSEPIENLSQGNISEKPLTKELKEYNDSLDFLDGNVKYSKYVIYIDPQNVDFIDSLTVKERKNLINGILRDQNDIALTKKRFRVIQNVIRHAVVAVLTLAICIPLVYSAINASLEATIDNHRRSQTNWQVLYKEHGKITPN